MSWPPDALHQGAIGATYGWQCFYHGVPDDDTTCTEQTDVAELTAVLDLLVVKPDGGSWGW